MHIFQAHNYDALFLDIVVLLAKRFPRDGENSLKRIGTLQILSMQVDRPATAADFGATCTDGWQWRDLRGT
ncbi:hypothetical protein [Sinorhizobium fredii]|uniref:hypothetical protein n=1 Tax=Rhizobium fredii TaxID=380 RepID=UPI000A4DE9F4|nr:hypothetical protein [Sinorhizobium fredii]WOS64681.1 hypothetical protein SFGR64A_07140 [Sinorhizobium fredii GR64]